MVSRMKLGCVAVVVPARPDVPLVAVKEVMVARGPNPTSSGIGRRGARGIVWSLKVMAVLYGSVAVLCAWRRRYWCYSSLLLRVSKGQADVLVQALKGQADDLGSPGE